MSETGPDKNLNDCGCCDRGDLRSPTHANRPGRDALDYRLGTHAAFLRRMLDNLSRDQLRSDEPGVKDPRPLAKLTTRGPDDPAVALMDAWAMAADVLTFYQERIANEGYLRTATERRSVLELARTIGYELNPGVAAGTFLVFTAETAPGMPEEVRIPKGNRVLSLPPQDKLPQTFETVEELSARPGWNELKPHTPYETNVDQISFGIKQMRLQGVNTGLKPGDAIAIVGDERRDSHGSERWDIRILQQVTPYASKGYTLVAWERGLGHVYPRVEPAARSVSVYAFRQRASVFGHNAPDWKSLDPEVKARYAPHGIEAATGVALSSDGTLALCATVDSTIKLYRISTGKVIRAFYGHRGAVNSAVFTDDDRYIISGGDDGTVRVWDAATGGRVHIFEDTDNPLGPVTCVAFAHHQYNDEYGKKKERKLVLSGSADGRIALWDLQTCQLEQVWSGHTGGVNSVALHPVHDQDSYARALSGGEDGKVRLWKLSKDKTEVITVNKTDISSHTCPVNSAAFSPDGKRALWGGDDGTVRLWDLDKGALIRSFGHGHAVKSVAFRPKTSEACSGGADGALKMWNAVSDVPISRAFAGHAAAVTGIAFSKNGSRLLSGSLDKTMKVWDAGTGVLTTRLSGETVERIVEWPGFAISADSRDPSLDLDNIYPTIVSGSWIALVKPGYAELYGVKEVGVNWRTGFNLSAKVTRLDLDTVEHLSWFGRRNTIVFFQSEQLEIFSERTPIQQPVQGKTIELETLEPKLEAGRAVAVSGRRMLARITDAAPKCMKLSADEFTWVKVMPGDVLTVMSPLQEQDDGTLNWHLQDRNGFSGQLTAGPREVEMESPPEESKTESKAADKTHGIVSEVAFIEGLSESRDRKRTVVTLTAALRNVFDHGSVTINANVARATHGETVEREVLGSGDGSTVNQRFKLKKKPLTYVSAPTPSGGETTLEVRVNDVLWKEAPSLFGLNGRSQNYIVRNDDEGYSHIIFGDGVSGARLPAGQENVTARYRSGTGPDGEVAALSLILPQTKPLGVRAVVNPLPATGAAPPENLGEARSNAPLTVQTLERIVSVKDFQDFAASFAGVGKARAAALWNGETSFMHITIATASGTIVDASSDLFRNLIQAMDRVRDTSTQVSVDTFLPRHFNVRARVMTDSRYLREKVEAAIIKSLQSSFSFAKRGFGQPVTQSEVVAAIHKVEGVIAVNVTVLDFYDSAEPALNATLPARRARWENSGLKQAELLLINPGVDGITLEEMQT